MASASSGWALLITAGAANATFGLPMKFVRRWQWENTWAVWSVLALLVLPGVMALIFVPDLLAVYGGPGMRIAGEVCLFGMGWGLAQVLFGRAMEAIGIGLAFSIVLGLSAAAGTLLPILHAGNVARATGSMAPGLALVLFGLAACAVAGRKRETGRSDRRRFAPGFLMAVTSGVLASMMNVGLSVAGPLQERAAMQGAMGLRGTYAVWLPLLVGGAAPNLLYCVYLLWRKGTWRLYRADVQAANGALTLAMALLWFFSTALYGLAAQWLGPWGVVLGWPVFMSVIVIGAGVIGMATGEWRGCGRTPVLWQTVGLLFLVLAIVCFSRAQHALEHNGDQATMSVQSSLEDRAFVR